MRYNLIIYEEIRNDKKDKLQKEKYKTRISRHVIRTRMSEIALGRVTEKDRKVAFLEIRKDRCIIGIAGRMSSSNTRYERLLFKVSSLVAASLYAPISPVMPFNK